MSDSRRTSKFTWGDSIRVMDTAPSEFRPGAYAAVCGVTEPDATRSEHYYTIEYDDGTSVDIAERHLAAEDSSANISTDGNSKV
jgi:hypothetical protein